jgi:hypothetical protein
VRAGVRAAQSSAVKVRASGAGRELRSYIKTYIDRLCQLLKLPKLPLPLQKVCRHTTCKCRPRSIFSASFAPFAPAHARGGWRLV